MYSALFGAGGDGVGAKPRLGLHSLRADLLPEGGASVSDLERELLGFGDSGWRRSTLSSVPGGGLSPRRSGRHTPFSCTVHSLGTLSPAAFWL